MKGQDIQDQFGICGVIFCSAGTEGVTVLGAGGGIDRVNVDKLIFPQAMNQSALFLFYSDRDLLARTFLL